MFNSLWPHRPLHTRLLCPTLSPGVCSNSCPLSLWCYLTISSSPVSYSFCLQSFPASGSFPRVGASHQVAKGLELQHQSLWWASIQYDCPFKRRIFRHRHVQRDEHVKTQGEDDHLQGKERVLRRTQPCQHLDFRLLSSISVREQSFVILNCSVCGPLLWQS